MSSLTVEAHRKRFTVKVTPMQPLSAVVADVLGQLKLLDVRPEDCTLSLRGKALDLSTPVRFAAAGRDKLELKTGREPVLGVREAPHASTGQPLASGAGAAAATQAQRSAGSTAAAAAAARPPAAVHHQEPPPSAAPAAGPSPAAAAPAAEEPSLQQAAAADAPAAEGAPGAASAVAGTGGGAPHPSLALFGMRVHVFTRAAEQQAEGAAGAAAAAAAEDDSFFEFTEADLRRAMASAAAQRAQQQGGPLMTAAMREREERRRAEAFGDVPIRLLLPDGQHCLQASLPATTPLSRVLELARAALPAELAPAAFLFTTPPRAVVKPDQLQRSLYAAKLVPAAKLHVGLGAAAAAGGPLIRHEVAALAGAPPPRDAMHGGKPDTPQASQAAAQGGGSGAASDRPVRVAATGSAAGGAKAVPKWLKLSK